MPVGYGLGLPPMPSGADEADVPEDDFITKILRVAEEQRRLQEAIRKTSTPPERVSLPRLEEVEPKRTKPWKKNVTRGLETARILATLLGNRQRRKRGEGTLPIHPLGVYERMKQQERAEEQAAREISEENLRRAREESEINQKRLDDFNAGISRKVAGAIPSITGAIFREPETPKPEKPSAASEKAQLIREAMDEPDAATKEALLRGLGAAGPTQRPVSPRAPTGTMNKLAALRSTQAYQGASPKKQSEMELQLVLGAPKQADSDETAKYFKERLEHHLELVPPGNAEMEKAAVEMAERDVREYQAAVERLNQAPPPEVSGYVPLEGLTVEQATAGLQQPHPMLWRSFSGYKVRQEGAETDEAREANRRRFYNDFGVDPEYLMHLEQQGG